MINPIEAYRRLRTRQEARMLASLQERWEGLDMDVKALREQNNKNKHLSPDNPERVALEILLAKTTLKAREAKRDLLLYRERAARRAALRSRDGVAVRNWANRQRSRWVDVWRSFLAKLTKIRMATEDRRRMARGDGPLRAIRTWQIRGSGWLALGFGSVIYGVGALSEGVVGTVADNGSLLLSGISGLAIMLWSSLGRAAIWTVREIPQLAFLLLAWVAEAITAVLMLVAWLVVTPVAATASLFTGKPNDERSPVVPVGTPLRAPVTV